ncbi:Ig-like domain-containing protein [Sphingobacterium corticibacterium]|nr:Ig-like domain-containing protein [Sphingobacterium corticibacterium]
MKRLKSNKKSKLLQLVAVATLLLGVILACSKKEWNQIAEEHVLVNTVSITPNGTIPLLIGRDTTLELSYQPSEVTNDKLIWYSSDESVATVDQSGKVTAVAVGTATITVESTDGGLRRATALFDVIDQIIYTEALILEPAELEIFEEMRATVAVTFAPENTTYKHLRWSTDNPEVATVDHQGNVTGVSLGTATITAHALDGSAVVGTVAVAVVEPIYIEDVIVVSGLGEVFGPGEKHLIDFSVLPVEASAQFVTWSSADESVVTVTDEGLITTVGYGETQVIATSTDDAGFTKSFTVKVEEGKVNDHFYNGVAHSWVTPTNGASLNVQNNILWVTMNTGTNRRGDFRRPNTTLHIGNYPIVAFKFTRPLPSAGNIFLDTNLGRWRQTTGNGNNQMTILTGSDGIQVFYADMGAYNTYGTTGATISETQAHTFSQIAVGVADFPTAQNPLSPFPVYWMKTFKTVAELEAYINQ